jgi:hypothetical protein
VVGGGGLVTPGGLGGGEGGLLWAMIWKLGLPEVTCGEAAPGAGGWVFGGSYEDGRRGKAAAGARQRKR